MHPLVLAWIYENREGVADPLGIVEEIYADFDYPGEVAPFVRYMPMSGPDLCSREKNEERMYGNWKAYLLEAGRHYAKLRKG